MWVSGRALRFGEKLGGFWAAADSTADAAAAADFQLLRCMGRVYGVENIEVQ